MSYQTSNNSPDSVCRLHKLWVHIRSLLLFFQSIVWAHPCVFSRKFSISLWASPFPWIPPNPWLHPVEKRFILSSGMKQRELLSAARCHYWGPVRQAAPVPGTRAPAWAAAGHEGSMSSLTGEEPAEAAPQVVPKVTQGCSHSLPHVQT